MGVGSVEERSRGTESNGGRVTGRAGEKARPETRVRETLSRARKVRREHEGRAGDEGQTD